MRRPPRKKKWRGRKRAKRRPADFQRMLEAFRTFTDGATPYRREEVTR